MNPNAKKCFACNEIDEGMWIDSNETIWMCKSCYGYIEIRIIASKHSGMDGDIAILSR